MEISSARYSLRSDCIGSTRAARRAQCVLNVLPVDQGSEQHGQSPSVKLMQASQIGEACGNGAVVALHLVPPGPHISTTTTDNGMPHDICTHCGAAVEPFTFTCSRCGADLRKSEAPQHARSNGDDSSGSFLFSLLLFFLPGPFDSVWWLTTRKQLRPHMLGLVLLGGVLAAGAYWYVRRTMPAIRFPEIILLIYAVAAAFALWVFYPQDEE